ncbi:MAG TPA: glycosyltransferase [Pyrinomonadaceae bacterium]|nr:glycosyltransferase [Pyrinomonadaceae bacterium]
MPNVLQLLDSFNQGGTEWQTVQLTRLLHESGKYRIFLASLSSEGPLRAEVERLGFHDIPSFPLQNFYNFNAMKQLARLASLMRRNKIDLVHAHDFYTNVFGMAAATLARVPARIASRRETEGLRSPAKRWLERRAFNTATAVVANAEAIRAQLIKEGLPEAKVVTIHNGLNIAHVTPRPGARREELLAGFGLPNSRRFVTIVANMRHVMKDQATFLRAARLTRDAVSDSAFILAGEGEQTGSLRKLAADLGLSENAFFIGRCNRIADLLAISDVCVLSSKGVEGFSNSILEYMAAARPVVATDVGGAREAVVDGETGYIVDPEDFETMAGRLIQLLREPNKARAMGEKGRRRVQEYFSCDAQVWRVEQLYGKLLKAGH